MAGLRTDNQIVRSVVHTTKFEPVRIGPLNNNPKPVYALAILHTKVSKTERYPTSQDFEPEMLLRSLKGHVSLLTLEMSTPEMTVSLTGILERLSEETLVETSGFWPFKASKASKASTIALLSYGKANAEEYQLETFEHNRGLINSGITGFKYDKL